VNLKFGRVPHHNKPKIDIRQCCSARAPLRLVQPSYRFHRIALFGLGAAARRQGGTVRV
jgi:hypothetical protein